MTIERVCEAQGHLSPSVFVYAEGSQPGANAGMSRFQPIVGVVETAASLPPALTIPEMVRALREAGLPISAIAEAARVERKTVYSWLDEAAAPREEHALRMADVYRALLPAGFRDLRDLYRMWSTPLASGGTLRMLLAADHFDGAAVRAAVSALWPKARDVANRQRMIVDGANGFIDNLEVTANP